MIIEKENTKELKKWPTNGTRKWSKWKESRKTLEEVKSVEKEIWWNKNMEVVDDEDDESKKKKKKWKWLEKEHHWNKKKIRSLTLFPSKR